MPRPMVVMVLRKHPLARVAGASALTGPFPTTAALGLAPVDEPERLYPYQANRQGATYAARLRVYLTRPATPSNRPHIVTGSGTGASIASDGVK